ncbi:Ku70/Ku80 beta-barrel domain protein [Teladorsagia circumcincta]|uniref:Ku70/Ku80 beta-barrel domain protein n=1 Tax=Teladorsagia circumcincta TaxID=45464 RepID=A0A2G9U3R9_TELCI|nr:Ku70/Ku80 beta-barrel domain protein [Teladorsagia circumcincta]
MSDDEFVEEKVKPEPKAKKGGRKEKYGALVLVIDCGGTMNETEDGRSHFSMAKEAADWIISRKIFTQSKDRISIVSFGTEETKNNLDTPNVYVQDEVLSRVGFDHLRFLNREIDSNSKIVGNVYYFGDTKVPIGEDDESRYNGHNFNEGEPRGCMKLIQFTKRENIKECYYIGRNSFVVVPGWEKKTSERDLVCFSSEEFTISSAVLARVVTVVFIACSTSCIQEAMRTTISLISAMLENDVVAICRYASDAAKHLQLMALIPHRDEELDFVYLQALRLPFAEDMRPFNFVNVSESCPKPNHKQMNLIDELIDVMQFSAESGRVLNAIADDDTGFSLEEIVKTKRIKQEIRQEDISEWLAELEATQEDVKPTIEAKTDKKRPQTRFIDRARDRLSDNFEFHMSSMLEEVVVMVSAEDEEAEQLHEIARGRIMSLRSLAIEFGKPNEFNEWLLFSKTQWPEWARFCASKGKDAPVLISNQECSSSEYSKKESAALWDGCDQ